MTIPNRSQLSDFNGVRDQIVRLRCLGNSYESIAKIMGLNYRKVKEFLDSEFKERFENREQLRVQTAMQLDWLARPLMEKFEETIDRRDAEAVVKILDRKCRLLGLDEAVKVDVRQVESLSDEDLEKELARYGVVKQLLPAEDDKALPESAPSDDIIDAEFNISEELPINTDTNNGEATV